MITPNKVITLRESALGRAPVVLGANASQANVASLYKEVRQEFESIDQFLLTIDMLYILGRIDVDLSTGALTYAD